MNTTSNPNHEVLSARIAARMEAQARHEQQRPAARETALDALRRLVEVARGDTGQSRVVRLFLLGLYNGPRWPFLLTDLRCLDLELQDACFAVLRFDAGYNEKEIHRYLIDGEAILEGFWREERPGDFERSAK